MRAWVCGVGSAWDGTVAYSKRGRAECLVPWEGSHGLADPAPHGGDLVGLGQHRVTSLPEWHPAQCRPCTWLCLVMASAQILGNQRKSTLSPPYSCYSPGSRRSAAASPLKTTMVRRYLFLCLPLEPHGGPFSLSGSLNNRRQRSSCCRQ